MSDFLKYFVPFSICLILIFGGFFALSTVTGRSCVMCEQGTAPMIDYSSPPKGDIKLLALMGGSLVFAPLGALAIVGLIIALVRITAAPKQREDAKMAKEMGEDGIGPLLFGG